MSMDLREALRHGEDCPAPQVMIEAMEHGGAGRELIAPHVEKCPACQTELAMFRGFETSEVRSDEKEAVDFIVRRLRGEREPEPAITFWQGLVGWLTPVRMGGFSLAAAAVLLTVGLNSQFQTRRGVTEPLPESSVTRSALIRGVEPEGEVAEFPRQIRWEAVAGAVSYEVTLTEVDRTVIFHNSFTTPVLEVPAGIRTLVVPGKMVILSIRATDANGIELAQSGQKKIQVRSSAK
jgi:hypothetical protein